MSNKLFQSLIYQMKEELDSTVGVIDDKGVIIACSQLTRIGETDKLVFEAVSYSTSAVVYNGTPISRSARTGRRSMSFSSRARGTTPSTSPVC